MGDMALREATVLEWDAVTEENRLQLRDGRVVENLPRIGTEKVPAVGDTVGLLRHGRNWFVLGPLKMDG